MFNRAKRTKFYEEKLIVSPASYNPYPKHKIKACRVPFNCSAPAHALADNGVPAPCTYNIRYREHRIKGGVSLRFTEPRKTFSQKPGPSPISYDPDLLYARSPKYQIEGKVCKGKPPRFGYVSPISVPYKYFDGFDIIKGKGIFLKPPRLDLRKKSEHIVHNFPYEPCITTLRYKGNRWSQYKSKRKYFFVGCPNSPGVGHYDLLDKQPKAKEVYLNKLRTYNKAKADSLKYADQFIKRIVHEDFPAPATYYIKFGRIYGQCSFNVDGTFSKAERFSHTKSFTSEQSLHWYPPPERTSTQMYWPPFNSSSSARPIIKKTGLSPALYEVYNDTIIYNLIKEVHKERYNAFNSTSVRETSFIVNDNPGPGSYNLMDKPKRIIYGVRDKNTYVPPIKLTPKKKAIQREIAPWTYNINRAVKILYNKQDFHKGPSWFKEKHFNRTKWAIKESPDVMYTFKGIGTSKPGQLVFNERPKDKTIDTTPGPADYNIHPLYSMACLKAFSTHNATSDLQKMAAERKAMRIY